MTGEAETVPLAPPMVRISNLVGFGGQYGEAFSIGWYPRAP